MKHCAWLHRMLFKVNAVLSLWAPTWKDGTGRSPFPGPVAIPAASVNLKSGGFQHHLCATCLSDSPGSLPTGSTVSKMFGVKSLLFSQDCGW